MGDAGAMSSRLDAKGTIGVIVSSSLLVLLFVAAALLHRARAWAEQKAKVTLEQYERQACQKRLAHMTESAGVGSPAKRLSISGRESSGGVGQGKLYA